MSIVLGRCRYCGCEGEACTLPNGDKCSWLSGGPGVEGTVCNAPGCVRAEMTRRRTVNYERVKSKYSGWGYGAILEDLRKRRRKRRRAA
jgi:hypothetical protein